MRERLESWDLLLQYSRREIEKRYRGSYLGLLWVVLNPLLMLGIYTFVFYHVLGVRGADQDRLQFVTWLYAGLILFFFFSDVATAAPAAVRGSPNYVKKVIFPLEVLVTSKLVSALFSFLVSYALLLVFLLATRGRLPLTVLWTPVVLLPAVLLAQGVAMALSSLGVFIRDVDDVVRVALRVLFYLTPIVYPAALVPEGFRGLVWLNPLATMVESFRRVTIDGRGPSWGGLAAFLAAALAVLFAGRALFNKTRPAFADVL